VISHAAAAAIHKFDLYTDDPRPNPEVTVPYGSTFHPGGGFIHRTRALDELDVVDDITVDGIRVTSKARTVADLASALSIHDLEIVLESALRSADPVDPGAWDVESLERLQRFSTSTRPGSARLRVVLSRRPIGCRPTGSIFETRGLQALRSVGLGHLFRQQTVIVFDEATGETLTVAPDFCEYDTVGITVEFDGEKYHKDRRQAERKRDNHVGKALIIRRFDFSTPLPTIAKQVRAAYDGATRRHWPDPTWRLDHGPNRTVIRIPRHRP
jgi:hypothetical protein